MTDPHDFDELASAHLDGATSPEEAALVAADPALQARVEELRAVRDALARGCPPVDADRRDAAIAAALAAFDEDAEPERPTAPVTAARAAARLSPTAVRVLERGRGRRAPRALLVPLLASIDDGGDDEAPASSHAATRPRRGPPSADRRRRRRRERRGRRPPRRLAGAVPDG